MKNITTSDSEKRKHGILGIFDDSDDRYYCGVVEVELIYNIHEETQLFLYRRSSAWYLNTAKQILLTPSFTINRIYYFNGSQLRILKKYGIKF
jgi:hypothetical protein